MENHYQKIVKDTDSRVAYSLERQELRAEHPFYGGFYDADELVHAKYAIYRVAAMMAAYCCADSSYYRAQRVEQAIFLGLAYIRRVQHENGLFDYITCNFFSAPDTAFCIKKLIPFYEFLQKKADKTAPEERMRTELEQIIRKGAHGLLEGGFHTPNHRWAIASMLAKTGVLFGEEQLTQAALAYLQEGIDCNADGEFSEKSAGNYNRINNDAMITLAEALGDDSYEQYAIRNLHMMLTYLEPDGSIFTANSTRFDKDRLIYPKDYYMEYLKLGKKYGIKEFLGMCNTIFDIVEEKQITAPDFLIWFLLEPEYRSFEWEERYEPEDFCKHYPQSGIVRARKGGFTYTVMRDKSDFLYVHNGSMKLMMKVAGSFCEHRAFKAEELMAEHCYGRSVVASGQGAANIETRTKRMQPPEIQLRQTMRGWYYLPFPEKPESSDWWQMDHSRRPRKTGPDMEITVKIEEQEHGLAVTVRTAGVSGAPWRIETAFAGIEELATEQEKVSVTGEERLVVAQGEVQAGNERNIIRIGPGFAKHRFIDGKEDSEAKQPGCATVYFTDYTEFEHTILITTERK
ncbi:MAG: hypothetical protein IJY09_03700 [Lachnospiraceae bacterium]|nr:hypothetical protein [Lachnospiraceae bacterium]